MKRITQFGWDGNRRVVAFDSIPRGHVDETSRTAPIELEPQANSLDKLINSIRRDDTPNVTYAIPIWKRVSAAHSNEHFN